MKAPITFAIAGFGDRGSTYASMQKLFPDRMKVVAVADINPEKVQKAKELYGIKDELCFTSAEEKPAFHFARVFTQIQNFVCTPVKVCVFFAFRQTSRMR